MHLLRHRQDAEDAAQTAFLSALEHLPSFRGEAAFKTWITRIVTNAAFKLLRRKKVRAGPSLEERTEPDEEGRIPHPELIAEWRGDPAALVEHDELHRVLDDAIEALPLHHRIVFVLRDLEGLSVEETARALEITQANVKVRLLRARLALREALTRVFGDEAARLELPEGHPMRARGSTAAEELLSFYRKREGTA
jgi:RNA polymerase sigma-70 factor (ECF subfamily)